MVTIDRIVKNSIIKIGVFIGPFYSLGKLRFGSKTGADNKLSSSAEKFVANKTDVPYTEFSKHWIEKGYTPIFEFCSKEKKVCKSVSSKSDSLARRQLRRIQYGSYRYETQRNRSLSFI